MTSNALNERFSELKITPSIGLISLEQANTFVFDRQNPSRKGKSIVLGDSKESVDMLLGEEESSELSMYAHHYQKGITVLYQPYDDQRYSFISRYAVVDAIIFYHESYTVEKEVKNFFGFKSVTKSNPFQTFRGNTREGIGFDSSVEDVIRVYGQPLSKSIDSIDKATRMGYKGIIFAFNNNQMVSIAIEVIG